MKDHEYFVYILCSLSGTLYIGMTNSIYRRALQHKRGEIQGFSSKYHCDRLAYYESFDDVHKAIGREKQLKGWISTKKIALIESRNPRWGRFGGEMGSGNAVPRRSTDGTIANARRKKTANETPSLYDITAKLRSGACVPAIREAVKSWKAGGFRALPIRPVLC